MFIFSPRNLRPNNTNSGRRPFLKRNGRFGNGLAVLEMEMAVLETEMAVPETKTDVAET